VFLLKPAARTTLIVLASALVAPLPARAEDTVSHVSGQEQVAPASAFEPRLEGDFGGEGRRTLGRFVPNLGRNILGVFAKDNLRPLLFGAAASGLASRFDGATQSFFGPRRRAEDLGEYGQRLGSAAFIAPSAAALLILGRGSNDARFRGLSYDIAQVTIVDALYAGILKKAVGRERPDGSDKLSFPSGHTSNAFAWATVANHYYGAKLGIPSYALAGLIGVSRLESNAHHLSDVVAGAALGVIVGRTVVRRDGESLGRRTQISVMPATDASGTGVGAALNISF
jgi:membrane-associated phospholipid phosphatase